MPHRIDGVAPELDAHRLIFEGGKKVQDAAAHGELTRALDLVGAAVAAADERVGDVLHGDLAAVGDRKGRAAQHLRRERALHQAADRGRDDRRAALHRPQGGEALLLHLAGDGLALVKGELAQPERDGLLAAHGRKVARHVLRRRVVGADHDERALEPAAQRGGQIGAVDRSEPGNERGKSSALRKGGEGGGFPVFKYLVKKDVHREGLYHGKRRKSIACGEWTDGSRDYSSMQAVC